MSSVINMSGLTAVWRRQLGSLVGNPLGYVFILAFVLISAGILFLPDAWFARGTCDLGPLQSLQGIPIMAVLLAVLVPALAMGAWSTERESGTEELLLTMPLTLVDAVLGKYLAVVSYATLALLCSLSNVAILAWLGDPDPGLIVANYIGWWLAVLVFSAWSLVASVLVTIPAISFVFGTLFCGALMYGAYRLHVFDSFNRGVISGSGVVVALAMSALGIVVALLILASRRWRAGREDATIVQVLAVIFALVLAANLSVISNKYGVDKDITSDASASLSTDSVEILTQLQRQVRIEAFISPELPLELEQKRQELEDRLDAIKRYGGMKVALEKRYPRNSQDKYARHAAQNYNLKPRVEVLDTVAGRQPQEVYLSAAVSSGGRTQVIEYFDSGVSVEYELMRAVRTVGTEKKRVLGVATTDLEIGSGFDPMRGSMRPAWQTYEEWKRQYEVRDVSLDAPIADEVETLVVPQPSSLTDMQMRNLHDYIWAGRPCVLMEDPLPIWSGAQLTASQPKKQNNPYGAPNEGGGPQKGDLKPLLNALGIDFDLSAVLWSDYKPSSQLANLPKNIVWVRREKAKDGEGNDQSSFADSPITEGFSALVFPFPGKIQVSRTKPIELTVTSLIRPSPSASWGFHNINEVVDFGLGYGPPRPREPKHFIASRGDALPAIAVQITGKMGSVYPKPDPALKPTEADKDKPPVERTGVLSAKDINVVVIADVDFCGDEFFRFYRDVGAQLKNNEDFKLLLDLRNVQFVSNVVDHLLGESQLVKVRSRGESQRPLTFLLDRFQETQRRREQAVEEAKSAAEASIDKAKSDLEVVVAEISKREDIDEATKETLAVQTRNDLERKNEREFNRINEQLQQAIVNANDQQKEEIGALRWGIRAAAIAIPAFFLCLIAILLYIRKTVRERTHVPAARARSVA
jgi:ABC-2 type transport system permease protein